MNSPNPFAEPFETHREHLRAVAFRMLGSIAEADDAVQEAWLRLDSSRPAHVENLKSWLTTVVARVCLDQLRAQKAHPAAPAQAAEHEVDRTPTPEQERLLADSVGSALLVVLEHLDPAERLALVLHDFFGIPFDEIAPIVGRTPEAARQLASRGRRRIQGKGTQGPLDDDIERKRRVTAAFRAAARNNDFAGLLAVLAPDAVLRSDPTSTKFGIGDLQGAEAIARTFAGRAHAAQSVLLDGAPGIAWAPGGQVRVAFDLTFDGDRISCIRLIADPDTLAQAEIEFLAD